MRPIRFRAYNKNTKQYHFFDIRTISGSSPYFLGHWFCEECEIYIDPTDLEEPQQFTGLYDKNGKEIYEGDICRNGDYEPDAHAYNYRIEEVLWDDENAMFIGWNPNINGMTCEVIGNIYEHSHLLEEA